MVWAVARTHERSPQDPADVSQVTWLLLTQHLGSLRRQGNGLLSSNQLLLLLQMNVMKNTTKA